MNTFFIGDTHFGHKNIIKYEGEIRAFDSIEEHDEELIKRWNSVVSPKDRVFHCGDVAFGREGLEKAKRLNGVKYLIAGNHDHYETAAYTDAGFTKILGASTFKEFIITHIPVHPSQLDFRYGYNIHGHMHSHVLEDTRYINVSAERINLTPINFEAILEKLK